MNNVYCQSRIIDLLASGKLINQLMIVIMIDEPKNHLNHEDAKTDLSTL